MFSNIYNESQHFLENSKSDSNHSEFDSDISDSENVWSGSFTNFARERSDRTKILNELMQIYIRHNLTSAALEAVAKLMNKVSGTKIKIPQSKQMLLKEFCEKNPFKVRKHTFCDDCIGYSEHPFAQKENIQCANVQCSKKFTSLQPYFVDFDVKPQLQMIIVEYFDEIIAYRKKIINDSGKNAITDVYGGNLLKRLTNGWCEDIQFRCFRYLASNAFM